MSKKGENDSHCLFEQFFIRLILQKSCKKNESTWKINIFFYSKIDFYRVILDNCKNIVSVF